MNSALGLRIEIPDHRACAALPALIDLLQSHQAGASFLFGLGPDWLGRLPTRHCQEALKRLTITDFEPGILGWQPNRWLRRVATAPAQWIATQFSLARAAFEKTFGHAPRLTAAPGWQSNPHALRLTQRLGFACASDTRGSHPFIPVWHGEIIRCPQIPVTLPTFAELSATLGKDTAAVDALLKLTDTAPTGTSHVFSLAAGEMSANTLDDFGRLLAGWKEQGFRIISLGALASAYTIDALPRHEIVSGTIPGHPRPVLMQGDEFLAEWRTLQ